MPETILFYDIPNTLDVKLRSWSPSTVKTRYALNFKGLPYKTVWVEYPDIKALCKEINAEPTAKDGQGEDLYTLPVIKDPNTGRVVSDSTRIADYLDETYPEHPLVPLGTSGLQFAFQLLIFQVLQNTVWTLVVLGVHKNLPPRSQGKHIQSSFIADPVLKPALEYFRRTREKGDVKLEEQSPPDKRGDQLISLEKGLSTLNRAYEKSGSQYIMGDQPTQADFIVGGLLVWAHRSFSAEEWELVMTWNNGRWKALFEALNAYMATDEGEVYQTK